MNQTINVSLFSLATTIITSVFITLPVQAITFISSRTALESNDQLNWSSLGQVFNPLRLIN